MAVPRNRQSNARKNSRRAHHAKSPVMAAPCPGCGTPRLAHRICASCGEYRGRAFRKAEEQA